MKKVDKQIDKILQRRSDKRAGNGGLYGGQRTVRNDKSVYFDGHHYFSYNLSYYLRQKVWVEYSHGNMACAVNIYDNNSAYRRLICNIDDRDD
jgi:hypothetical protein